MTTQDDYRKCERCGAFPAEVDGLHDYCARCSRNLCDACMKSGCCGSTPAESGEGRDMAEEMNEALDD